jgi:hypothetical protein
MLVAIRRRLASVRAMDTFHKANATRFKPWLCVTTVPLFAFSCVSLGAPEPPWEGESAKRDFLLQTSVGAYAMTGHWWRRYYWYCHLWWLGWEIPNEPGAAVARPRIDAESWRMACSYLPPVH